MTGVEVGTGVFVIEGVVVGCLVGVAVGTGVEVDVGRKVGFMGGSKVA
jgi:hypothetical protein